MKVQLLHRLLLCDSRGRPTASLPEGQEGRVLTKVTANIWKVEFNGHSTLVNRILLREVGENND